ncbi:MAG TPA: hypothetical protein VGE41_03335 [Verrucomicrobiae bacterium]|jgi:hypothetical protein
MKRLLLFSIVVLSFSFGSVFADNSVLVPGKARDLKKKLEGQQAEGAKTNAPAQPKPGQVQK